VDQEFPAWHQKLRWQANGLGYLLVISTGSIQRMNDTAKRGYKRANIALLSVSTGIELRADAMQLSNEIRRNI
jgi:hypothetical protein